MSNEPARGWQPELPPPPPPVFAEDASVPPDPDSRLEIPPSPSAWIGQFRLAWTEGPLCRRIFRAALPWALLLAAVEGLQMLFGWIAIVLDPDPAAGLGGLTPAYLAVAACAALFSLLWLGGILAAPLVYAWWAHKRFWLEDEAIRTAPFSGAARTRAVLAAAFLLALVANAPSMLLGWPAVFNWPRQMVAVPIPAGAYAVGALVIVASSVLTAAMISLWVVFTASRCLARDAVTGFAMGHGWAGVATAYGVGIGIQLLTACLVGIAAVSIMFVSMPLPGPAGIVIPWSRMLATMAMGMVGAGLGLLLIVVAARHFAARDLPLLLAMYRGEGGTEEG